MANDISIHQEQLELFAPAEVTRPDINIAKWAGWIFSSPWSKDLFETKERSWEFEVDGKRRTASIAIIPANGKKRPTITTSRIFGALIQIWEQSGKPESGEIIFSARQLASIVRWKWAGKDTATRIQEHLSILNGTTIDWERSFFRGGVLETLNEEMSLVDAKAYLRREKMVDREFFYAQHRLRLNRDLVANMIAGKTKPFKFDVYVSITDETHARAYNYLDVYLSGKFKWERALLSFIRSELELDGKRYESRRTRKAFAVSLINDLNGRELSNGTLQLALEEMADGSDYKIVARRTPHTKSKRRFPPQAANHADSIPHIVDDLMEGLQFVGSVKPSTRKWLEYCCLWYSRDMLFMALGLLKGDYRGNVKTSVIRAYSYVLHRLAHERGLEWVKECGKECPYRPENLKKIDFKK